MSPGRQLLAYGLVGGLQLLLDWGVFFTLTSLGAAVVPANLAGRVAGACVGFWLNGRYTFAGPGAPAPGRRQAMRFTALWLATTAASTLAMHAIDAQQGLQAAWLLKPLVEAALAAVGFLAAPLWIYRP